MNSSTGIAFSAVTFLKYLSAGCVIEPVCAEATPSNGKRNPGEGLDDWRAPNVPFNATPIANATTPLIINRFEGSCIYILSLK
jgi:hypothetical protein